MLDTENIYLFTPLFLLPVLTAVLASQKPGRLREGDITKY